MRVEALGFEIFCGVTIHDMTQNLDIFRIEVSHLWIKNIQFGVD